MSAKCSEFWAQCRRLWYTYNLHIRWRVLFSFSLRFLVDIVGVRSRALTGEWNDVRAKMDLIPLITRRHIDDQHIQPEPAAPAIEKKTNLIKYIFIRIKLRVVSDVSVPRARFASAVEKKQLRKKGIFSFSHFVKHLLWLWAQLLTNKRRRCTLNAAWCLFASLCLGNGAHDELSARHSVALVKRSVCTVHMALATKCEQRREWLKFMWRCAWPRTHQIGR